MKFVTYEVQILCTEWNNLTINQESSARHWLSLYISLNNGNKTLCGIQTNVTFWPGFGQKPKRFFTILQNSKCSHFFYFAKHVQQMQLSKLRSTVNKIQEMENVCSIKTHNGWHQTIFGRESQRHTDASGSP